MSIGIRGMQKNTKKSIDLNARTMRHYVSSRSRLISFDYMFFSHYTIYLLYRDALILESRLSFPHPSSPYMRLCPLYQKKNSLKHPIFSSIHPCMFKKVLRIPSQSSFPFHASKSSNIPTTLPIIFSFFILSFRI